jgi:uncharacterized protein
MTPVFVDTAQWVAFMRPEDNLNAKAVELAELLDQTPVVTSEPVLIEVLNFFSNLGPHYRRQAVVLVDALWDDPTVEVEPQTTDLLKRAIGRYDARQDKNYSATDCISMLICERLSIAEVATNDHGFEQEGFTILLEP